MPIMECLHCCTQPYTFYFGNLIYLCLCILLLLLLQHDANGWDDASNDAWPATRLSIILTQDLGNTWGLNIGRVNADFVAFGRRASSYRSSSRSAPSSCSHFFRNHRQNVSSWNHSGRTADRCQAAVPQCNTGVLSVLLT